MPNFIVQYASNPGQPWEPKKQDSECKVLSETDGLGFLK